MINRLDLHICKSERCTVNTVTCSIWPVALYRSLITLCSNFDVCAVQSDSDIMTSGLLICISVEAARKIDRQDAAEYDRRISSLYRRIFPSDGQLVIELS